jgi:hypothetical protein
MAYAWIPRTNWLYFSHWMKFSWVNYSCDSFIINNLINNAFRKTNANQAHGGLPLPNGVHVSHFCGSQFRGQSCRQTVQIWHWQMPRINLWVKFWKNIHPHRFISLSFQLFFILISTNLKRIPHHVLKNHNCYDIIDYALYLVFDKTIFL